MGLAVVVAGSPCSGKTTLGAAIASDLKAVLIDKDTLEWPLANAALVAAGLQAHAHDSELYTKVLKHAAYETMERVAEQNATCGLPVVLVAPFSSHVKDKLWQSRLQARLGVEKVLVLWVTARHDVLLARKAARATGRDQVDGPAGDPTLFAAAESARTLPVGPHSVLDTTHVAESDMHALALQTLHGLLDSRDQQAPPTTGGVVCAGHACIDVIMEQCAELPSREGYAAVERFSLSPGGAVSNTAMQLARLGVAVDAMTVLGDDEFGRLLLSAWQDAGVCTRYVTSTGLAATSCAALPVYKVDSKRAVYACQGSNATITGADLLPKAELMCHHQFFALGYPHIMPLMQGSPLRKFLAQVAEHVPVALDVNEAFEDETLPLGPEPTPWPVAVFHCNLEEAAACLGRKQSLMEKAAVAAGVSASQVSLEAWISAEDVEQLALELIDKGIGIVLITLGENGAFGASCDEARLRTLLRQSCPTDLSALAGHRALVPAYAPLGAVNSVGAGDCFLAGVLAALCHFSSVLPDQIGDSSSTPSLETILRCGCASSLYRVDTGRISSSSPVFPVLLHEVLEGSLKESGLANSSLSTLCRRE